MVSNDIDNQLIANLIALGFKKKRHYFVKNINKNVFSTISFNTSVCTLKGHTLINPFVGVGYIDVNQLYLTLCDVKNCVCPTIWQGLGYLMPDNNYKEWDFINEGNNDDVLSDMFSAILLYGEQYWKRLSDFDELFKAVYIRETGLINDRRERLLPVLYYMKGEKQKGVEFIEKTIKRSSIRPTDKELLAGQDPNSTIILRSGEGPKHTTDELEKMLRNLPSGGSLHFVGAGYNGHVDPEYLKFAERYKQLP